MGWAQGYNKTEAEHAVCVFGNEPLFFTPIEMTTYKMLMMCWTQLQMWVKLLAKMSTKQNLACPKFKLYDQLLLNNIIQYTYDSKQISPHYTCSIEGGSTESARAIGMTGVCVLNHYPANMSTLARGGPNAG